MKKVFLASFCLLKLFLSASAQVGIHGKLDRLFIFSNSHALVAAHRGDWRNAPENSLRSTDNAIGNKIDIVEIDLKLSKDSVLFLMHDKTIDRTTTGKGRPEDHLWAELKTLKLRSGTGHPTRHSIPTLEEVLNMAKGKIIVDIDKGYDYLPLVLSLVKEKEMQDDVIINVKDNTIFSDIEIAKGLHIPENIVLMEVVNMERPDVDEIVMSYRAHKKTIIQCIFATDTLSSLKKIPFYKKIFPIWLNGLWPEQNGGHDDDRAFELQDPIGSWGWLIKLGANIIQSDRPKELYNYINNEK